MVHAGLRGTETSMLEPLRRVFERLRGGMLIINARIELALTLAA